MIQNSDSNLVRIKQFVQACRFWNSWHATSLLLHCRSGEVILRLQTGKIRRLSEISQFSLVRTGGSIRNLIGPGQYVGSPRFCFLSKKMSVTRLILHLSALWSAQMARSISLRPVNEVILATRLSGRGTKTETRYLERFLCRSIADGLSSGGCH